MNIEHRLLTTRLRFARDWRYILFVLIDWLMCCLRAWRIRMHNHTTTGCRPAEHVTGTERVFHSDAPDTNTVDRLRHPSQPHSTSTQNPPPRFVCDKHNIINGVLRCAGMRAAANSLQWQWDKRREGCNYAAESVTSVTSYDMSCGGDKSLC